MSKQINTIEESIKDSSITYKGSVTTETIFKNKIIDSSTSHNEGHTDLFKLIANSIAGVYDPNTIPRYICGYNSYTKTAGLTNQTITSAIPYSSKKVQVSSSNESYQIVFSFLIPYSQISTTLETKYYGLYSDPNLSTLIAHVELSPGYKSDEITNKVVTWTMSIGNQTN